VKKITETSKLNISLVEIILSEEKCGEGDVLVQHK
jgi:hypothetical protein